MLILVVEEEIAKHEEEVKHELETIRMLVSCKLLLVGAISAYENNRNEIKYSRTISILQDCGSRG